MTRRAKRCLNCRFGTLIIEQPADATKRHIPLTQGKVAIIDAIDYDRINQYKWSAWKRVGKDGTVTFYAVASITIAKGRYEQLQMHRFILNVTDPNIQVDHRNQEDTLNNCRSNLRESTPAQNQQNRRFFGNTSGYKGVAFIPAQPGRCKYDRYRGVIIVNGDRVVSGIYRDPILAAKWYDRMAVEHFGEFARINFPHDYQPQSEPKPQPAPD